MESESTLEGVGVVGDVPESSQSQSHADRFYRAAHQDKETSGTGPPPDSQMGVRVVPRPLPLKLWKAMHAARKEMGSPKESGVNVYDNYTYPTLKDYLDVVQGPMNKHEVLFVWHAPQLVFGQNPEQGKAKWNALCQISVEVVHVESGESHFYGPFIAQAYDRSDKAGGKAITAARKEAIRVIWTLYSDADADNETPASDAPQGAPPQGGGAAQQGKPTSKPASKPKGGPAPDPMAAVRASLQATETPEQVAQIIDSWVASKRLEKNPAGGKKALEEVGKEIERRVQGGGWTEEACAGLEEYVKKQLANLSKAEAQAELPLGDGNE